mmetsp:Transcript_32107/g.88514  ORF Transcript_32107/g.88514 Transcript_32107/m.88514 type:complete len:231 (-) Transcript_32107:103-795(-)
MASSLWACSCCHSSSSCSLCRRIDWDSCKRVTSFSCSSAAHSACRCALRMPPRARRSRRLASKAVKRACCSRKRTPSRSKAWPPESMRLSPTVSLQRSAARTSARQVPQSPAASVLQPRISTQTWHCVAQVWSWTPHAFRHPVMIGRSCAPRMACCLDPVSKLHWCNGSPRGSAATAPSRPITACVPVPWPPSPLGARKQQHGVSNRSRVGTKDGHMEVARVVVLLGNCC